MYRVLVAFALAACGGERIDCERTITAASERTIAFGERVGLPLAGAEHTRQTMIAACEPERWSGEVMHCLENAQRETDLMACTEKLTHEQYERLHRSLASRPPPPEAGSSADLDPPLWVGPMPMDAGAPAVPAAPAASCANTLSQPRSRACIAEYCSNHPDDLRCLLE